MEFCKNKPMQIMVFTIGGLLIIFLLLSLITKGKDIIDLAEKNYYPSNTISITGKSSLKVMPDTAYLLYDVPQIEDKEMQGATNKLKEKAAKFISFLENQGVNKKEVWILNYSSFINDTTDENGNAITKYQVSETIKVKVADKEKLADKIALISEEATKEGLIINSGMSYCNGNEIESERQGLFISNPEEYQRKLKIEALKDAIKQAKELTSITGLRLGGLVGVSDYSSYPFSSCAYLGGASNFVNEIEIGGTINVNFEIRR